MQYLNKLKELPQQNFYMAVGTLLNRLGSAALPFLLVYLHNEKNVSVTYAGVVLSCYGLGALFSGPASGWLSDRYGAHLICVLSLFTSGIVMLIYPLVPVGALTVMTFLWGLMGEGYRPASQVIISHFCLPEQRKVAYALNRLAVNLGMSIAPLLGGVLILWSFSWICYLDGLTSVIAAAFIYRMLWSYFRNKPLPSNTRLSFFTSLGIALRDRRMLHLVLAMILSLVIFFQHAATLSLFMINDLHLAPIMFSLVFLLNTMLIIFVELPLNIKLTNTRFNLSLALSALLIAAGFGVYYFAQGAMVIAIGAVIWTLGEMILFPALSAYIFEIAPENYRGAYMGFYSLGVSVAFLLGPLLGTFLYNQHGKYIWLICFAVGLLSSALFYKQDGYEKTI
ncbi:MAG: MFS transporter [Gammaproteobacteria bacterium]